MPRQIAAGLHWIQECGPDRVEIAASLVERGVPWYERGKALHVPQNAYLLVGEKTLLFDTLSPAAGEKIVSEVERVLGDRDLDYLVVSHPDVPHAGNTARLLRRFPTCRLVAPAVGDIHELYHLEDSLKVAPGDTLNLGGPSVRFLEATFLDAAMSVWMVEETTNTLFPVDWLGFPHMAGECLKFSDEVDTEIGPDRLAEFHRRVMFWFQYVDTGKVRAEIRRLARELAPAMVAPSHGLVIRSDPLPFFSMMEDVVHRVASQGRAEGL
jgi:flavorubredoxin